MERLLLVGCVWGCVLALTACDGANGDSTEAGGDAGPDAVAFDGSDAIAPDDLAAMIDPYLADGGLPALTAAVFRGDQLIAVGASGVRKLGDPTPASTMDEWHLGSDGKAMTATLIGIYVEKGTIHFEDTISTLFAGESIDPGYANVTLEQLLQHTGGAPEYFPSAIWSQMWDAGTAPNARISAVLAVLAQPPAQSPGTFVYSDVGYVIAGAALERAAGATWEQLITTSLFTPLSMGSCGFGAPGMPNQVDQPWGHQGDPPVPVSPGPNADNPPSFGPAGTVHCSLADWGKFLAVHLAGARGQDTLLKASTIQRLQTPPPGGNYADGWIVATNQPWANGPALTHSGSNTLWFATVWLAPKNDMAYVAATNCATNAAPNVLNDLFLALIPLYPQ